MPESYNCNFIVYTLVLYVLHSSISVSYLGATNYLFDLIAFTLVLGRRPLSTRWVSISMAFNWILLVLRTMNNLLG